jgi:hypothetical protein
MILLVSVAIVIMFRVLVLAMKHIITLKLSSLSILFIFRIYAVNL